MATTNSTASVVRGVGPSPKSKNNLGSWSPDQELNLFGTWCSESVWVPPKDSSTGLAKSMLNRFGPCASKQACWESVVAEHRSEFTQVREIALPKSSIRLPQGRLFVAVTERKDFDKIEDVIPDCVRTRLDEFLDGRGRQRGVKVYYLKPLCVEVDNQLVFTTRDQLNTAISLIQAEVFSEYRRLYLRHRARKWASRAINAGLAVPRSLMSSFLERKKREIEAYHAHLEFERRKRALAATQTHRELRSHGCTFDEMLSLMDSPNREDVIDHYVSENELSRMDRQVFLIASAVTIPWFVAMSIAVSQLVAVSITTGISVGLCDPAFVAEMPDSGGALLKIGHFDQIDGVMHVEI